MAAERANLRGALGQRQDLSGSDLRGALMVDGLFAHSTFFGADLSLARLEGADFSYCDLRGTNLTDTVFAQTALKGARGVDWDRVGPGRWLVTRHEGLAHGGLGELEQDFVFEVSDQKNGKTVARYEASLYRSYWGSSEPTTCGPVRVEITPDGCVRLVGDDGRETLNPLPK